MYSDRYGDLELIADLTDGACHLCHEPVDLAFYGPTGHFGDDTVTVDHLRPQHHGGSDRVTNLRLAHGTCNSIRGTRRVADVRLELAGTSDAPLGAGAKTAWSLGGGAAAGVAAGFVWGHQRPDGTRQFNPQAALIAGGLVAIALRLAL